MESEACAGGGNEAGTARDLKIHPQKNNLFFPLSVSMFSPFVRPSSRSLEEGKVQSAVGHVVREKEERREGEREARVGWIDGERIGGAVG